MRIPDAASCAAENSPTDRRDKAGWTDPRSKGRIVFVPIGFQKKTIREEHESDPGQAPSRFMGWVPLHPYHCAGTTVDNDADHLNFSREVQL